MPGVGLQETQVGSDKKGKEIKECVFFPTLSLGNQIYLEIGALQNIISNTKETKNGNPVLD